MGEIVERNVFRWIDENSPDSSFPNEDWDPLQLLSSIDHVSDAVRVLVSSRLDNFSINRRSSSRAVPSLTALHIAVMKGRIDIIDQLIKVNCDVNTEDQYGFTALHYAVINRNNDVILLLIAAGASVSSQSKSGSTPLDLAKALKLAEIEDILLSKMSGTTDPTLPNFKEWLCHVGAGEYISKFLSAGYDLPFIVRMGLQEADLDCVGIPMSKLGVRKKILALHDLSSYYQEKKETEEDEEDEDESGEDEDDSDDDEDEESNEIED